MVGDPSDSHTGDGHRGQALLPTVDYTDGEVTIDVPYQVYKCNGRSLTPETSEGKLLEDGTIEWNQTALSKRLGKTTFDNPMCVKCKMLPVCMGPCSQKCMELNWQNLHQVCSLKA